MTTNCRIFKSARKEQMYLYVREDVEIDDLPDALLTQFGEMEQVMELSLTPDRKLARVEVTQVIGKLAADGFYLQMPPADPQVLEAEMRAKLAAETTQPD